MPVESSFVECPCFSRPVEEVDARVVFKGFETDSHEESVDGPMSVLGALLQAVSDWRTFSKAPVASSLASYRESILTHTFSSTSA